MHASKKLEKGLSLDERISKYAHLDAQLVLNPGKKAKRKKIKWQNC